MVAVHEWLSPTRTVGLISYTAALIACGIGWVSCLRNHIRGRLYLLMAATQFLLLLDMAFDWRWKLHDFWGLTASELGVYGPRRLPQVFALAILCAGLAVASVSLIRRFRGRGGAAIAAVGTVLSVGLWFCEVISYHYLDAILYRLVGKVMVVSLAWSNLAAAACLGIWFDVQRGSIHRSNLEDARSNSVRARKE